jgi:hypothetical protein
MVNKLPPDSTCNRAALLRALHAGHACSSIGTALYFTGLGAGLALIAAHGSAMQNADPALIACGIAQLAGPVVSCIGGDISSNAMESCYPGYERHKGWRYYGTSWALMAADVVVAFAGTALAQGINNPAGNPALGLVTLGAVVVIGIDADINIIKAVVCPLAYSSRALRMVQ